MQEIDLPFEQFFQFEEKEEKSAYREQTESPSYAVAYHDREFLESDIARSIRISAEVVKPEFFLRHYGIHSTVIVFGSARFLSKEDAGRNLAAARAAREAAPNDAQTGTELAQAERLDAMSRYYEQAREFARIVSEANREQNANGSNKEYIICTGGGPGIMEAANRGAHEAGALSIGLNIKLPNEQRPNPYISPPLCFQFHYFAIRKLHFLLRAKALVVAPGGFGTFDELFEALTLRQTNRMQPIPIIIFGEEYWRKCIDFDALAAAGVIDEEDLNLFQYTDSPQEAWDMIREFYTAARAVNQKPAQGAGNPLPLVAGIATKFDLQD